MKKIMLASMVAAVALLAGCEIVVEDPSCEATNSYGIRTMCVTGASSSFVHSRCIDYDRYRYDTYEDFGCVGGAKKICTGYDESTNTDYTIYYYTNKALDYSCDELYYQEDDYGDYIYLKNVKKASEAKK